MIAPYTNEHKSIGDKLVQKYNIIGASVMVYNAWEPSGIMGKHSTITFIDGKCYGRIGSRHLSPEIDKLPALSNERLYAVRKAFEEQYQEAYNLIIQAFPEAADGSRSMGDIELIYKG